MISEQTWGRLLAAVSVERERVDVGGKCTKGGSGNKGGGLIGSRVPPHSFCFIYMYI